MREELPDWIEATKYKYPSIPVYNIPIDSRDYPIAIVLHYLHNKKKRNNKAIGK